MKIENLEKANVIQKRMRELEKVRKWMETKERKVYIIAQGCTLNESVSLSTDCRALLYGLCLGEHSRLQDEFEGL